MLTAVTEITTVSNQRAEASDYSGEHPCQYVRVDLAERLAHVAKNKFAGNDSEWCLKAGLSRSALAVFRSRYAAARKAGKAKLPALSVDVLRPLARAADVSFDWLATGVGELTVERDARYPSLERVIREHPGRWLPGAEAQARSIALDADEDPGEARWTRILDAADSALRVGLSGLARLPDRKVDPLDALDD
jgi:hypothetical protein